MGLQVTRTYAHFRDLYDEAARARDEHGYVPTVTLGGVAVPVRAAVEQLSGLSAHADRTELRAWLDALPDVRRVALHHGEVAAQRAFARWMTAARVPA